MSIELRGKKKKLSAVIEEKALAMRYNPLAASTTEVSPFFIYPELKNVAGMLRYYELATTEKDKKWRNKALWYVIWVYSDDSVLNTKPPEPLPDRKLKAFALAAFEAHPETNQYDERVIKDLMHLSDADFVWAVLHYIRHQKGDIWGEIIVSEEQLFEALRLRLAPSPGGEQGLKNAELKKKLRLETKELRMDIRALWDEFYTDNDDLREEGHDMLFKSLEDRARINVGQEIDEEG